MLNREKELKIFGPQGFLDQVQGKLQGYTWNLTAEYPFSIQAFEVHPDRVFSREFLCQERFVPREKREGPFTGIVAVDSCLKVQIAHLDHLIPTLAFTLHERFHINVHKDRLEERGVIVGPWLQELKAAIWREEEENFSILVPFLKGGNIQQEKLTLKTLKWFLTISPGQKIAYVTDCRFTEENVEKIRALAREADIFFCEAAFSEKDHDRAEAKAHLTARQAGQLARMAGVKKLQVFHFSPKYEKDPEMLIREAEEAFQG
jgi:ribonuclease Z